MRLIDADALKQAVNERYHDPWIDMLIRNATAVDAVPVVRCCDCKHCDIGINYFESWCYCKAWRHSVNPTDFCSYGKRKEA